MPKCQLFVSYPQVYHIGFLDFTLFEDHPEFFARYQLRNAVDNYLYTITYRPNEKKQNTPNPPVSAQTPLKPAATSVSEPTITPPTVSPTQPLTNSKTEALRELKQLLDEGVLTQEEYDKEKAKLLESN